MRNAIVVLLLALGMAGGCPAIASDDLTALREEVAATERAFAATMASRDLDAFASFIAADAVFFSGPKPLQGKAAIVAAWSRFYEGAEPPFSWGPDTVEVLESGTLALSSGPVYDPAGKQVGRFNSIWRREAPGVWRVVFDKGEDACRCAGEGS